MSEGTTHYFQSVSKQRQVFVNVEYYLFQVYRTRGNEKMAFSFMHYFLSKIHIKNKEDENLQRNNK